MKKDYELLNFFRESMLPDLRGLEAKRKSIAGGIWIEAALLAVLIAFAFLSGTARVGGYGVYILIAGAAWLIWSGISIYGKYSEFKSEFKQEIIFRLIRFIDPGLSYSKDSCLPYPLFLESNIFLTQVDRYGAMIMSPAKSEKLNWNFPRFTPSTRPKQRTARGTGRHSGQQFSKGFSSSRILTKISPEERSFCPISPKAFLVFSGLCSRK